MKTRWWGLGAAVLAGACSDVVTPYLICSDQRDGGVDGASGADLDGGDGGGAIDLRNDPMNCGCVGRVCRARPDLRSTSTCVDGRCTAACEAGYFDCNGRDEDGCEVHVSTDPQNCGMCGGRCGEVNGVAACVNSRCTLECLPGWGDCSGGLRDGCEADLRNDANNCRACGRRCQPRNAVPVCRAGECDHGPCDVGYAECNNVRDDGCEAMLSSRDHCGSCNNRCMRANATATCEGGACALGPCDTGFANCDGSGVNGCEIDVRRDMMNCGACGNVCSYPNATASCENGVCVFGRCLENWSDCNNNRVPRTDGCEVSSGGFATSSSHCGGCNRLCSHPMRCMGGSCALPP